jgi:hypothetical protein
VLSDEAVYYIAPFLAIACRDTPHGTLAKVEIAVLDSGDFFVRPYLGE